MGKLLKRKYLVLTLILVGIITFFVCSLNYNYGGKLSETQIAQLREQYPIYGIEVPEMVSMSEPSLERTIEIVDSFVYGEVMGEMTMYSQYISTGNAALDKKREANGINNVETFFEYKIRVIEDTEGEYQPGEEITIVSNAIFIDYDPVLHDGMKMVIPVARNRENPSCSGYSVTGMYYVTDDGYALSAFPEEQKTMQARGTYSGVKVEYLLKQLKKK